MKAVVFTLGCKVNGCESEALIAGLTERGYEVSDKLEKADVYIVNTCAVTAEAEKKSRQTASRISKLNPEAKIIFTGCAAEKNPESFKIKSDKYLVTGVFGKNKILEFLDASGEMIFPHDKVFEELTPIKTLKKRAFIKVQDGCDNFCSYCIIPYLRGRSRSRDPEKIKEEIIAAGAKEAVITGIDLSDYEYRGLSLAGLLEKLKDVKTRIRLGSLEARVITEEFLNACKNLYDFAPHFHLSLQSGSDAVLKKMNRHYTAREFLEKTELVRKFFPDAGITTDVIAGFPTETEEDFSATLSLIEKAGFTDIHPFIYSPRSGTAAYKMKDLPYAVKKRRLDKLLEIKEKIKSDFVKRETGKILSFLPEEEKDGYTAGYTGNYLRLYVKGCNCEGPSVCARVIKGYADGAIAELV